MELVAQIADLQAELLEAMNENNALKSKNYEEEINVSKLKLQFQVNLARELSCNLY